MRDRDRNSRNIIDRIGATSIGFFGSLLIAIAVVILLGVIWELATH